MHQCTDCGAATNVEHGPSVPLGRIEYVTDRYGNKVVKHVRCQSCLEKYVAAQRA